MSRSMPWFAGRSTVLSVSRGDHGDTVMSPGADGSSSGVDQDDVLDRGLAASSSVRVAKRSVDVTSTRTSQSARMYATCLGRSRGLIGTKTPPAADVPKIAATVSMRLSR